MDSTLVGQIFAIEDFAVHDGPGIRTTVFLKGCTLRCFWCHNPESIDPEPAVQFFAKKCIGCGQCIKVCPAHAHRVENGSKLFMRRECRRCGRCTNACFSGALVMAGKTVSVAEVIAEVEKDKAFYENSDGGVTFSGGEPLAQPDFLKSLLVESKCKGFHTAVDTALNVSWDAIAGIRPYTDLFLLDIKTMDARQHQSITGVDNTRILQNIRQLCNGNSDVWIRIPVIPTVNDNVAAIESIADFITSLKGVSRVELIPFHHLGKNKYAALDIEYKAKSLATPSPELMKSLRSIVSQKGGLKPASIRAFLKCSPNVFGFFSPCGIRISAESARYDI